MATNIINEPRLIEDDHGRGMPRASRFDLDPLGDSEVGLDEAVRHFEKFFITRALELTAGNQKRAAELHGLKHTTLHAKIRRHGINAAEQRVLLKRTMHELAGAEGSNE